MSSERETESKSAENGHNQQQQQQQPPPPPPQAQATSESDQPKDFSSIIEKLKTGVRRSSNSSSVSTTSMTGAIEMTSGPVEDFQPELLLKEAHGEPIQVQLDDDSASSSAKSEPNKPEPMTPVKPIGTTNTTSEPVTPLEMIFNSAKKGQVTSLADPAVVAAPVEDDNEVVLPPPPPQEPVPVEEEKTVKPPPGLDPMSLLLQNLKKQTEEKKSDVRTTVPGQASTSTSSSMEPTVLIFGDETLIDLEESLNHAQLAYAIEVHMLEGAETKNIQKYIQETLGTKKEAQLCIFHVGTNDLSSKRSESQYNTDLMLLFGACRSSFPNARLCCSSVLPRHDEFVSKVAKFNQEADAICEVCAVEFLNNTKVLADIENYVYNHDPSECVALTPAGVSNLATHFLCFIEDSLAPAKGPVPRPRMILGPKIEKKLPKDGYEVRNLTPVTELNDEKIFDEPRVTGDGSKLQFERDGTGDGSQSPLPPSVQAQPVSVVAQTSSPVQATSSSSSSDIRELIALVRRQSEKIDKLETKMAKMEKPGETNNKAMERVAQELKRTNMMLAKLPQHTASNGVDNQMSTKMIDAVLPNITTRLNDAIERTTLANLNGVNNQIKDQLERTLNSAGISQTVSKAIEMSIRNVHRASMEAEVIPRFEKATREMFRQISETFTQGTQDYMKRLELQLATRVKAETGAIDAAARKVDDGSLAVTLTNEVSKVVQVQLANEMKKVQLYHQEQQAYVNRAMLQMRQLLNADVEKLLNKHRNELDLKVEDAIARAQTPAPMSAEDQDLREQLRRMIQRGQYNEAFTKALMASDLPVVIDLLEMVDQSKIFLATGGSTLEAKTRQNFNSADESAFSSTPSPTSITETCLTRSTLTPSPPTMIAPPPPPIPPPPPPPSLAPNFKVAPPAIPPKPARSVTKLKNGYYADSESNCGSIDRRQVKTKRVDYEKIKSDLISGVDDFFDSRPVSRTSKNHCRTRTQPNSRPLSRLSTFSESSLPVESDTETRLEQFFLMNKY